VVACATAAAAAASCRCCKAGEGLRCVRHVGSGAARAVGDPAEEQSAADWLGLANPFGAKRGRFGAKAELLGVSCWARATAARRAGGEGRASGGCERRLDSQLRSPSPVASGVRSNPRPPPPLLQASYASGETAWPALCKLVAGPAGATAVGLVEEEPGRAASVEAVV
jgi:hypothetical protein